MRRERSISICYYMAVVEFALRSSSYRIRACTSAPSSCVRCSTSRRRPAFRATGLRAGTGVRCAASGSRVPEPISSARSPMDIERCRYIVVEGPIGAGKTSLARQLAEHLDAEMLLEQPEDNPFLHRFYDDMPRFALPTQLTFLFQRVDQLRRLAQLDLFREPTISDFLLDKDPLFARLNLSDDEYALYEKVYRHLKPQTADPDLVIYLQAPVETLLSRVRMRGIGFEQSIPDEYLARLADAYARFFYQYDEAPLLIIHTARQRFVDTPTHFKMLLARIAGMRGRREFFNLGHG